MDFLLGFIPSIISILLFIFANICFKHECHIINMFKNGSVIVFGKKGSGKDLLFQYVINARKKESYLSNMSYGGKYEHVDIKDLDIGCSYKDFIDGNITQIDKNPNFEGKDIYLSDVGIHLPSQYDTTLHKIYPSFSVYYALSRQLYDQNIHCNTQSLERPWKALREQGEYYIKCNRSFKFLGFFIISFTSYDKYSSAKAELLPLKAGLFSSKDLKARVAQYNATNGNIQSGFLILPKRKIKYDTRYFEKVVFTENSLFR